MNALHWDGEEFGESETENSAEALLVLSEIARYELSDMEINLLKRAAKEILFLRAAMEILA